MAIAFVNSVRFSPGGSTSTQTSGAIDTTGANFLAYCVSKLSGGGTPTVSDSKSNTWVARTIRTSGDSWARIYYVENPTVGSGHTFSIIGTPAYYANCDILSFSGMLTSSVYDTEGGAAAGSGTSLASGSVTPNQADSLILSVLGGSNTMTNATIDGGFTRNVFNDFSGSAPIREPIGTGYLIQGAAAAVNPAWSWTSSQAAAHALAVFKGTAAGGLGGPLVGGRLVGRAPLITGRLVP